MSFPEADKFLSQSGKLSGDLLERCADLEKPPAGFERIWAAFEPMEVMQKRGQILRPQTGEAWQLLCDEGAALGGTDWAPPPLAYFAAGMAASVAGAVAERAAAMDVPAEAVSVETCNNYSLKGSILLGTMEGKGHDPDVAVGIDGGNLTSRDIAALAFDAVSSGLAGYLMKSVFVSEFSLTLNGAAVETEVDERILLVHFLREARDLTGTHIGCDTGHCGACTVDLDGRSVKSCMVLAVQADGAEVMTVEGLATNGELHPLQQGFMEEHGLQCGFCTPGMLLRSYRLLEDNPDPSDDEIRAGLAGNLCRCTGYQNIVKAVRNAAAKLKQQEGAGS